jgi:hypothetical protein
MRRQENPFLLIGIKRADDILPVEYGLVERIGFKMLTDNSITKTM